MFRKAIRLLAFALTATISVTSTATEFPERPLKIVVPMGAGGGTDIIARVLSQKLAASLGQAVIVENRAGAGGQLGAEYVASSAADGYTMLLSSSSALMTPFLRKTKFDLRRDFVPVGQVGTQSLGVIASPLLPFRTFPEFIAAARANPNKFTFGSPGMGSVAHLAGELLRSRSGIEMVHVPFKSSNEVVQALMGGTVDIAIDGTTAYLPGIEARRLRGFATTGKERAATLPNLPTVNETQAIPGGFETGLWFGLFLPVKTPPNVVERVRKEFAAVMKDPEVVSRVQSFGLTPSTLTADQFKTTVAADAEVWRKLITDNRIEAN